MTTTNRILGLVVPPLDVIRSLEQLVELKRAKGIKVSARFTGWLDLVKCIRTDLPNELDTMTAEQWQEASEIVGRYVTNGDTVTQPALLNAPRKAEYA